jgi:hypothetical protein
MRTLRFHEQGPRRQVLNQRCGINHSLDQLFLADAKAGKVFLGDRAITPSANRPGEALPPIKQLRQSRFVPVQAINR